MRNDLPLLKIRFLLVLLMCKRSTNTILNKRPGSSTWASEVWSGERGNLATHGGVGAAVGDEQRAATRLCAAAWPDGLAIRLLEAVGAS